MDGVNIGSFELGHLVVCILPVLCMLESSPAVGDNSTPMSNTDKVSREAIQVVLVCCNLVHGESIQLE